MEAKMLLVMCWYLIGTTYSTSIIVNGEDLNDLRLDMLSMKEEMQLLRSENALLKIDVDRLKAKTDTMMDTIQTQREEINALHEDRCHSHSASNDINVLDRDTNETIADTMQPRLDDINKTDLTDDDDEDVASNKIEGNVITNMPSGRRNDREGCVIKTKRGTLESAQGVAFSATVTPADLVNLGQGQTIIFDYVISNLGNAYDNRVGIFRVPVNGWYVFSLTLMSNPDQIAVLQVNINGIAIFHVYASNEGYNSDSKTIVRYANSGDDVFVRTTTWHDTDTVHGYGHTSFTVFLLYVD